MTTWKDYPDTSTPITAAALNDLESRATQALNKANTATENLNATTENLTTRTAAVETAVNNLNAKTSPTTTNLAVSNGWQLYAGSSQIKSIGALHLIALSIYRQVSFADLQPRTEYQIATLPTNVTPPPDWTVLGVMQFAGGSTAVCYRSSGRRIILYPLSSFRINVNDYGYAQCAWIA